MANDHDKFTCGCSDCNSAYESYQAKIKGYSMELRDYTTDTLKLELKRREEIDKDIKAKIYKLEKELEDLKRKLT